MKNKAQILLIALCFFITKNKAQTYFNNRYDLFGKGDFCSSVFTDLNNYYLNAGGLDATQTNLSLSTIKLDLQGNIIASKHYFKNQSWYYPRTCGFLKKTFDTLLLNTGYRTDVGYNSYPYIYMYKKNLDSVKYKEYGYPSKTNVINNSIIVKHKFIYMVGYVDSSQTHSKILIIKTDTSGNEIWKKKISLSTMDEYAISIDTLQQDLVLGVSRRAHDNSYSDGSITRIDTAGNLIWNHIVYTNLYGGCGAKTLKDGNILIYSSYKKYTLAGND